MESKKSSSSSSWSLQMMRWFLGNRSRRSSSCIIMRCPPFFGRGGGGGGGGREGKMKTTTTTRTTTKRMIKLIRADGVVQIYEQPIQVSQLISQFPKHMVCSSDSFYIGQKIPPLSGNQRLKPGQSYFLLPNHLFHSALSFLTITTFIASTTQSQSSSSQHNHFKKALLTSQPFHIHKTPSGVLRVNVSEDFISKLIINMEQQGSPKNPKRNHHHHHHLCTTRQLQKDYAQLVTPRLWKPKLDTIKEKHENKTKTTTTSTSQSCAIKTLRKKSYHQTLHTQKKNTPKSRLGIHHSSSSLSPKLTSKSRINSFLAATRKKKQIVL